MEIRGLSNDGENNCYLNVLIQIFWNFPEIKQKILTKAHSHSSTPCVTCELSVTPTQSLFISMEFSGTRNFSINNLKSAIFSLHDKEINNEFGCAIENFEQILEIFHKESEILIENNCSNTCLAHYFFSMSLGDYR